MSLLSRRSIPATPVLILVAVTLLLSLPVSWSTRVPGSAIAPAVVWAGGSPDETLAPHKGPSAVARIDTKVVASYRNAVLARKLWAVLWRVSAALPVKF